jgi:peptidyl-tRNA hydrolase
MANLIQRILIRTDLNMPVGLLAAQVAHIHALPFIPALQAEKKGSHPGIQSLEEWSKTPYLFVHGVPNKEVLQHFRDESIGSGLLVRDWEDTIYIDISETQRKAFDNVLIGISIGPADSDRIKTIVGDLPLL